MLDTAASNGRDIDVTLLYQAVRLKDIVADNACSRINKGANTLHILHLNPERPKVAAEEVPHYIFTVKDASKPLEREGMLTLTARTEGKPVVIANLLTVTPGAAPGVHTERHEGCIAGVASGKPFAFSTNPGARYDALGVSTDALAITGDESRLFCALATVVEKKGKILLGVAEPATFEIEPGRVKICLSKPAKVRIGVRERLVGLTVNGRNAPFFHDRKAGIVQVELEAGEWEIAVKKK